MMLSTDAQESLPAHCLTDAELRHEALAIIKETRGNPDELLPDRWFDIQAEQARRRRIDCDTQRAALRQDVGPGHLGHLEVRHAGR